MPLYYVAYLLLLLREVTALCGLHLVEWVFVYDTVNVGCLGAAFDLLLRNMLVYD